MRFLYLLLWLGFIGSAHAQTLTPLLETQTVGDAEDVALWVHPTKPVQSRLIATDTDGALVVFDLKGHLLQRLEVAAPTTVDIVTLEGFSEPEHDLALVVDAENATLLLYQINRTSGMLKQWGLPIRGKLHPEAACLSYHPETQALKAYAMSADGAVEIVRLVLRGRFFVPIHERILPFKVGMPLCASYGESLYGITEAGYLFRYDPNQDQRISSFQTQELAGLAVVVSSDGGVVLGVMDQELPGLHVLDAITFDSITRYTIRPSDSIDTPTPTAGLAVTFKPLGVTFPKGLWVIQDQHNHPTGSNYKLIPTP